MALDPHSVQPRDSYIIPIVIGRDGELQGEVALTRIGSGSTSFLAGHRPRLRSPLVYHPEWAGAFGMALSLQLNEPTFAVDASLFQSAVRLDNSMLRAVSEALEDLNASDVLVPDRRKVQDYLMHHPDMLGVVIRGVREARKRLTYDSQLSLELYADPEIDDSYLTLYVRAFEYDRGIFQDIDDILFAYEPELVGKSGWFLVTTDLRLPR